MNAISPCCCYAFAVKTLHMFGLHGGNNDWTTVLLHSKNGKSAILGKFVTSTAAEDASKT